MPFRSTKMWGPFSCVFRQPNADSHCRFIHGYGLRFRAVFECSHLDSNNWVMDFGGLKSYKAWLEDTFDHKLIVPRSDPAFVEINKVAMVGACDLRTLSEVGCEAFARHAGLKLQQWLNDLPGNYIGGESHYAGNRVNVYSMECMEHENNSAIWFRE